MALALSGVAMAQSRVSDHPELSDGLRALAEEVRSWEVLPPHAPGIALLASPPRVDPVTPGVCIREVLRIAVDAQGHPLNAQRQADQVVTHGINPVFRMFALAEAGRCELPAERFFRARRQDGAPAPAPVLALARDLAAPGRLGAPSRIRFEYLDAEAPQCMKHAAPLQILDVRESAARSRSLSYRIVLGGCTLAGTDRVVTADATLAPEPRRIEVRLWALPRAEYDCLQVECYRETTGQR